MTEIGEVVKTYKKSAVVKFPRKTACENCHMCMKNKKDMFVRCVVENSCDAKVGDSVRVEMGAGYVIASAVIVYLIPLALMVIALLATLTAGVYAQIGAVLGALILGAVIAVLCDRRLKKKKGFVARMTEIIKNETEGVEKNER